MASHTACQSSGGATNYLTLMQRCQLNVELVPFYLSPSEISNMFSPVHKWSVVSILKTWVWVLPPYTPPNRFYILPRHRKPDYAAPRSASGYSYTKPVPARPLAWRSRVIEFLTCSASCCSDGRSSDNSARRDVKAAVPCLITTVLIGH